MRLTLDEYSKHFKMSKEMINSKLRTKKLNYIIENGVTYIIISQDSLNNGHNSGTYAREKESTLLVQKKAPAPVASKPKTTVAMVLGLYQKENQQLKDKIVQLEAKIDKLIDDKEQMLRDEMSKIEQVYSTKDEQLKNILELVNAQLVSQQTQTIHEAEPIENSILENTQHEHIVELKNYLKTLEIETYQKKVIKKKFLAAYGSDIRIIKQNGKLYLNFTKYDYSDLLEY